MQFSSKFMRLSVWLERKFKIRWALWDFLVSVGCSTLYFGNVCIILFYLPTFFKGGVLASLTWISPNIPTSVLSHITTGLKNSSWMYPSMLTSVLYSGTPSLYFICYAALYFTIFWMQCLYSIPFMFELY